MHFLLLHRTTAVARRWEISSLDCIGKQFGDVTQNALYGCDVGLLLAVKHSVSCARPGAWCIVHGVCCMLQLSIVHCAWCIVHGVCCLLHSALLHSVA